MTTTTLPPAPVDDARLEAFVGRFAQDFGTLLHAVTVLLGDRLSLYAAMADGTPVTPADLATRTGVDPRWAAEWLAAQHVADYVEHDADAGTFRLPAEHAAVLIEGASPVFAPGAFLLAGSGFKDAERLAEAIADGRGFGWHQHDTDLFTGTEKLFRPGYAADLVDSWLPALDGVTDRLAAGATVADVGCGLGASTLLMARSFPASTFRGSDYHEESIRRARSAAEAAGLADRVTFEVAPATAYQGGGYDLVTTFDCLHDMGDPVAAARHIRQTIAEDGTWLLVEPMAGERLADNVNPVGKIFYAASTFICTPAAQAQAGGTALGAQTPEATLEQVVAEAGFTRFRRATETPFNRIYEVRP